MRDSETGLGEKMLVPCISKLIRAVLKQLLENDIDVLMSA